MQRRVGKYDGTTGDEALAAAFAARAPGALEAAYARHIDVLYAVARSVLGASQDAQDCVHDTVLRVWLAPNTYLLERGTLRAFLVVCVRNDALSRRRSETRRAELESESSLAQDAVPDAFALIDPVERARLRAALDTLPREQRAVIELAYAGERTQAEIAAQLGIPLGTVKSRVSLALRKLAVALGPVEG